MTVPLPLFPDWAQPFLNALPFRALADIPYRIYTGHIPPAEALPAIASGALWAVALVWIGRLLLARGQRVLVVQGG